MTSEDRQPTPRGALPARRRAGAGSTGADPSIVIVGTGFAGLAMAIRLRQAGIEDFVLLEKAASLGGVWRDNHYPGAACDIESHLYSFSFAPNPDWSRTFAPQAEILAYLDRCADRFGLRDRIRFNSAAVAADFDEASGQWTVTTSRGEVLRARVVVSAAGHALTQPVYPDLPGLDRFAGARFHSARWDHSVPLAGKRVAVIGTGASAIQIVPSIAPRCARLHLFQRTAPWVLPRNERAITDAERARFRRFPWLQQAVRAGQWLRHELLAYGFIKEPRLLRLVQFLVKRFIAQSVPDPVLRRKVTPDYTLGCKRILLSNDYYPALALPQTELVTERIAEVRPHSIVTSDGVEREVDALVMATGFEASEARPPMRLRGLGGLELATAWADGIEAYLGTTIAGFPNLFLIVGPNVGLGHSSMIYMIESQVAYILDAIRTLRALRLRAVEVRREAEAEYNRELQERLARTVWQTGGCASWYRDRRGRNTTLWPGFTFEFRFRTSRFDPEHYQLTE